MVFNVGVIQEILDYYSYALWPGFLLHYMRNLVIGEVVLGAFYRSKYTTRVDAKTATAESTQHVNGTANVDPYQFTIEPMKHDKMNWAMNTELPMIEMSVPSPRTCLQYTYSPFVSTSNCAKYHSILIGKVENIMKKCSGEMSPSYMVGSHVKKTLRLMKIFTKLRSIRCYTHHIQGMIPRNNYVRYGKNGTI